MQEDGIQAIELDDLLIAIRRSLPDGAQQVFDIITERGDVYQRYLLPTTQLSIKNKPKTIGMANFLTKLQGQPVSQRQINQWLRDIRLQALAHGLNGVATELQ